MAVCGSVQVLAGPPGQPAAATSAPVSAAAVTAAPVPVAATLPARGDALIIPSLTAVELVIDADLGSKTSQNGQTFPIALHRPLVIGGKEILPAGTPGRGEVVWAKKSGGSGASGELVLAARYLDVNGRQLRLRSMRVAEVGEDRFKTVHALNIATAATVPALAIVGFFISGKQAFVTKGTIVAAKTAEEFILDDAAAEENAAASSVSGGGAVPPPTTGGGK